MTLVKTVYRIYSEWDMGEDNYVFASKAAAWAYVKANYVESEVGELEALKDDCLITVGPLELLD